MENPNQKSLTWFGPTAVIVILACFALKIGIDQRMRNHEFVRDHLIPIADYVVDFRTSYERLPSEEEFRKWSNAVYENKLIDYHIKRPSFVNDWGKDGHDFLIGMWRSGWIHYYRSWDGRDFPDPK